MPASCHGNPSYARGAASETSPSRRSSQWRVEVEVRAFPSAEWMFPDLAPLGSSAFSRRIPSGAGRGTRS